MGFLGWVVFGFLAGLLARAVLPGKDPGGFVATTAIGVAGAVVGGWIGTQLGWGSVGGFDIRSMGVAVIGAVVLLALLRTLRK